MESSLKPKVNGVNVLSGLRLHTHNDLALIIRLDFWKVKDKRHQL